MSHNFQSAEPEGDFGFNEGSETWMLGILNGQEPIGIQALAAKAVSAAAWIAFFWRSKQRSGRLLSR